MKPLTDDQRKLLVRFLQGDNVIFDGDSWGYTGAGDLQLIPDFTTYEDLGKLKDKLVENGEWSIFFYFAMQAFAIEQGDRLEGYDWEYAAWLFRPKSCGLVAEYLEQKEGK